MSGAQDFFGSLQSYGNYTPDASPLTPNYFQGLLSTGQVAGQSPDMGVWERLKSSGILSSTDDKGITSQGWGMPALAAGQGVFNAWMGMKQYGLYKDQLNESKRQFGLNFDAQKQTTNSALEDRQRARVASNPSAYQSVGDYMAANGIRG